MPSDRPNLPPIVLVFPTRSMATKVRRVTEDDLVTRRAEILGELGLTSEELEAKVESGGLVGRELVGMVRDRRHRLPRRA